MATCALHALRGKKLVQWDLLTVSLASLVEPLMLPVLCVLLAVLVEKPSMVLFLNTCRVVMTALMVPILCKVLSSAFHANLDAMAFRIGRAADSAHQVPSAQDLVHQI